MSQGHPRQKNVQKTPFFESLVNSSGPEPYFTIKTERMFVPISINYFKTNKIKNFNISTANTTQLSGTGSSHIFNKQAFGLPWEASFSVHLHVYILCHKCITINIRNKILPSLNYLPFHPTKKSCL